MINKIDEFSLALRIRLNKILYDENNINLEEFQDMENYLIKKISKFKHIEEY